MKRNKEQEEQPDIFEIVVQWDEPEFQVIHTFSDLSFDELKQQILSHYQDKKNATIYSMKILDKPGVPPN